MRIGILSDSHGRVETTRRAVQTLTARGVDLLIHLGDIGSEAVIDELVGHPAHLVFGNCDDEVSLGRYAALVGVIVDHPLGLIEVDGRRIVFTHGHLPAVMKRALTQTPAPDYLLHGHTHEVRDERQGPVRIINPGALSRAARYTAAVLDPGGDALEIIDLGREKV